MSPSRRFGRASTEPADAALAEQPEAVTGTSAEPVDLVTAAGHHGADAGRHRERIRQGEASAAAILAAGEQDAAQVIETARANAAAATAGAASAEQQASAHDARARLLRQADALRVLAGDAERQADALDAERERLAAGRDALDGQLALLAGQRDAAEQEAASARAAGDVDGITAARSRAQSIGEAVTSLTGQRDALAARIGQVGGLDGPGELAGALDRSRAARAELWPVLGGLLDGDGPRASEPERDALLRIREEQAAWCSAVLAAERGRIAELVAEAGGLMPRLVADQDELAARLAEPDLLRSVESSIALHSRAEHLDAYVTSLAALLASARPCLDDLRGADPAGLPDLIVAGRRMRASIRHAIAADPGPLPPDDYDPAVISPAALEELRMRAPAALAAESAGPARRQRVVTPGR